MTRPAPPTDHTDLRSTMASVPLSQVLSFDVKRVPPLGKTCDSCLSARRYRVTATAPDGHSVTNDFCEACSPTTDVDPYVDA